MIWLLNGVRIHPNMGFTHNGTQYPPGWLARAQPEDLATVGIETRDDNPIPDQTWYTSSQRDDGTWNSTPRDLEAMAPGLKQKIKDQARNRILAICPEWKQTNIVARGVEVLLTLMSTNSGFNTLPPETIQEVTNGLSMWTTIKNIRAKSAELEAQIDAVISDAVLAFDTKTAMLVTITSNEDVVWTA